MNKKKTLIEIEIKPPPQKKGRVNHRFLLWLGSVLHVCPSYNEKKNYNDNYLSPPSSLSSVFFINIG